ncbi:MAG: hypothetical protein HF300_18955 [Ignavibacteria bacterium]|nr:hypothetical protein [Ignavibacteria bacterium]MCU7526146.1 hypothetical protein [Ignavibacteria bacterium]
MRAVMNIFLLTFFLSVPASAKNGPDVPEKDSLSEVNKMTIEVNVPEAHTIETELGFVENGGILFTRQTDVTVFGTVKTAYKLEEVKINGRKAKFSPEGDRYKFQRRIHLEDEYNTVIVSVTDVKNTVKDMAFTIHRKSN